MTEEKQESACDTLFVVGKNHKCQLGLGHRMSVKEITKWTADDTITGPISVHNGFEFAILSADNCNLGPLTFGFIRETCNRVPEPIMQVCVDHGVEDRCFAFGHNKYGQCGVGSAAETVRGSAITYFSDRAIRIASICTNIISMSTFWIASGHIVYGAGWDELGQLGPIGPIE